MKVLHAGKYRSVSVEFHAEVYSGSEPEVCICRVEHYDEYSAYYLPFLTFRPATSR